MILPQLRNGQPASSCGFLDQAGRRCLQEIAGGGAASSWAFAAWGLPGRGSFLQRELGRLRFEVGRGTEESGIPSGRTPLRSCSLPAPHLAAETIAFQGSGG